jgi:hypothetical protein
MDPQARTPHPLHELPELPQPPSPPGGLAWAWGVPRVQQEPDAVPRRMGPELAVKEPRLLEPLVGGALGTPGEAVGLVRMP